MSAPRLPRPSPVPLTNLQVALCLILGLAFLGLLYVGAVEIASVVRFVGWRVGR